MATRAALTETEQPTSIEWTARRIVCGCPKIGDPNYDLALVVRVHGFQPGREGDYANILPCPNPRAVEDLGTIAYWHRNPLRRIVWAIRHFAKRWRR